MTSIYDFTVTSLQGEEISLQHYAWKYLLIVNTASKCGLNPQLEWLEKLYKQYQDKGLVILWFPSNQFYQEFDNKEDIAQNCLINYGVTFPIMEMIAVNGKYTNPLYVYLKKALPGFLTNAIKRNFTKFLIWPDGTPLRRFAPTDTPEVIDEYLINLIK